MSKHAHKSSSGLTGLILVFAALAGVGEAGAATVSTSIQYDTLGLANTSWLTPFSIAASDNQYSSLDNGSHESSYFEYAQVTADSSGEITSSLTMSAAGRIATSAVWSDTFSNTSGKSQSYAMTFSIGAIRTELGGYSYDPSTRNFQASYLADIRVNGVSVWSSSQVFSLRNDVASLTTYGADIGTGQITQPSAPSGHGIYEFGGYDGKVDLGTFINGQSFNVQYSLTTTGYWDDFNGCVHECESVALFLGNPYQPSGKGISVTAVPEPETWALLLSGLGMVGAVTRRRRNAR